MPDRKNVEKALEFCSSNENCAGEDCSYFWNDSKEVFCRYLMERDALALLKKQKPQSMTFRVIDPKTGKEPIYDGNHIGKEKWFRDSYWNPRMIDEWIITESGQLGLMDRGGQIIYPSPGRFEVIWDGGDGDA